MALLPEYVKHLVDSTLPEKEELPHSHHPKADYTFLLLRNVFVGLAAVLFLMALFVREHHTLLNGIAYVSGAVAYLAECLAVTDCFRTKVPHTELFMVYCFGPLYLLMGLNYLFWH